MAMNLLKMLNARSIGGTANGGSGSGSGDSGNPYSTSASAKSKKRVYTYAEQEMMKEIQFLLARMETLALAEDRRSNMEQLTAKIKEHADLPVEGEGLRILMNLVKAIQTDRQSPISLDLSLNAVELIKALIAPPATSADGSAASDVPFVSIFVQNPAYITTLLDLLEEKHSVLRLYTIQILTSLLLVRREKIQSVVLNQPMGVIRMVELLSDPSEVIRNETLLLLEALTSGNQAIQKIVAFNGAFDKLLTITAEEIQLNGGVIAEDALRLIASLLCENTSNQYLFMEQGGVSRLIPYLTFREDEDNESAAGPGGANNNANPLQSSTKDSKEGVSIEFLGLTLEILNLLVESLDYSPQAAAHKNTSTRHALSVLLAPLLRLAVGVPPPPEMVQREALALVCMIVDDNARTQAVVEDMKVEVAAPPQQRLQHPQYAYDPVHNPYVTAPASGRLVRRSALRHLLELCCDSSNALERELVLYFFRCFFHRNKNGQQKSAMSFTPNYVNTPSASPASSRQNSAYGSNNNSANVDDEPDVGLGSTLLSMLSGTRPQPPILATMPPADYLDRCRIVAAQVLQCIVYDNYDVQSYLLTLPLVDPRTMNDPSQDPPRVLDYYIQALFQSQNHPQVELALLSLLCTWSDHCLAFHELLFQGKYSANLKLYLVHLNQDANVAPETRGLATYYMALVLDILSNPSAAGNKNAASGGASATTPFSSAIITAPMLLDLITKQIGLEKFKANLAGLAAASYFLLAEKQMDNKQANPLAIYRRLEEEELNNRKGGPEAGLSSEDEQKLYDRMHAMLLMPHTFTSRFKLVQDKCDQRLLSLFTSAAAAPVLQSRQLTVHHAAGTAHGQSSTAAAPGGHSSHPPNGIHDATHSGPAASVESSSSAAAAAEIAALREEASKYKQELDVLKNSSAGGPAGEALTHFQQLRSELWNVKQQLEQTQKELSASKSHAGSNGVAATNGVSAAVEATAPVSAGAAAAELKKLKTYYTDLVSEHEDLLILLAQQEIELEGVKKTNAELEKKLSDRPPAAAAMTTAATAPTTQPAGLHPHAPLPAHTAPSAQQQHPLSHASNPHVAAASAANPSNPVHPFAINNGPPQATLHHTPPKSAPSVAAPAPASSGFPSMNGMTSFFTAGAPTATQPAVAVTHAPLPATAAAAASNPPPATNKLSLQELMAAQLAKELGF